LQEEDEGEDGKRSVVATNLLQEFAHGWWVRPIRCSGSCKNLTKICFSYRARACVDEGFVGFFFWLNISWGFGEKKKKDKEEMSGFDAHWQWTFLLLSS
jgi:hypothetical protein